MQTVDNSSHLNVDVCHFLERFNNCQREPHRRQTSPHDVCQAFSDKLSNMAMEHICPQNSIYIWEMCESIASFGISSFWHQFLVLGSCSDDCSIFVFCFLPLSLIPGYQIPSLSSGEQWHSTLTIHVTIPSFARKLAVVVLSKPIGAGAPERNWADVKTMWDSTSANMPREGGEKSNYLWRCAPSVPDRSPR